VADRIIASALRWLEPRRKVLLARWLKGWIAPGWSAPWMSCAGFPTTDSEPLESLPTAFEPD